MSQELSAESDSRVAITTYVTYKIQITPANDINIIFGRSDFWTIYGLHMDKGTYQDKKNCRIGTSYLFYG